MCPIGADFKHFQGMEAKDFRLSGKDLSIMRANAAPVTSG
jgi:hypothetical protein